MSQDRLESGYIAVEGVIGVGKTSFAQMLSERLGARLINEEVFENPFLADFYKDRKRYALSCQLYFLISRFQQQQQLMVRDLFAQKIVADYLFAKDAIFASVILSERELLDRIRSRNHPFERPIDAEYIELLNNAYDYFFFHYNDTPLLVVKTDEIDFVHRPEHFDDLIDQISKPLAGKKYYSPSAGQIPSQS